MPSSRIPQKLSRQIFPIAAALLVSGAILPAPAAAAPSKRVQAGQLPIIVSEAQARTLIAAGAKVVDLRSPEDYAKGHVPGAINLPWRKFNQREADGIRNEFVSDEVIQKEFAAAGLSYNDTLVLYDTHALPGRAFVIYEYAGFSKVHVLDGGVGAWKEKLTTEATTLPASHFKLDQKKEIRVDKAFVASKVGKSGVTIIDGRDEEAYLDGHIPGAENLPAPTLLTTARTLKPQAELNKLLAGKQLTPQTEVVSYCGSGVYAANNYLALRNLGYKKVAFYDASWDEWSRDPKAGQSVALGNYAIDGATWSSGHGADGVPGGGKSGSGQFLSGDQLKQAINDGKTVILDVRSAADYDWGHIPGAVNVFWNNTLNTDRTLKSPADLSKLYRQAGVTPDKRVVIYARGGYQLTHTYTALSLLGYKNIDFFTGKFEGWKSK